MAATPAADEPLVLNCAGAFQGRVSVGQDMQVRVLRERILAAAAAQTPDPILDVKLIVSGRNLTDLDKSLKDYGVTSASRILVLKHADSAQKRAMDAASERDVRIKRLRQAVDAMSGRAGSASRYSLQLENQDGTAMRIDSEQRSLITMGLTLHESGKKLLAKGDWTGALRELELSEESFDLCSEELLKSVDNIGLLLLDSVWCLFKLQDSRRLAAARAKLRRARSCLAASHGANLERLRVLHGDFQPELAIYVRLEVLEGLSAFYGGAVSAAAARESLLSAQVKWQRLAVSDGALASMLAMGFTASEASRALRFCSGDVQGAASFLLQQRQQASDRRAADRRKRAARIEVEPLGRTAIGKEHVDVEVLEQLQGLGFERALAAQALLQGENKQEAALSALLDPECNAVLQLAAADAASRSESSAAAEKQLRDMGFAKWYVREALKHCQPGDFAAAVAILSDWAAQKPAVRDQPEATPPAAGGASAAAEGSAAATMQQTANQADVPAAAAQLAAAMASASAGTPPLPKAPHDIDHKMEEEVASLMHRDSLSGYDVDVTEEGNIIREFLGRLEAGSS